MGISSSQFCGTYSLPSLDIPKDKDLNKMIFGRQIDHLKKIREWLAQPNLKKAWLSQKRQSFAAAMREFKDLYQPKEWYTRTKPKGMSPNYYDDGIEVFYID